MPLLLILGFVVVAVSGVVYRCPGARAAGLSLAVAAVVSLAVSIAAGGRDAVGELAVGGLTGLPVLIGGALMHARDTKSEAAHAPPT